MEENKGYRVSYYDELNEGINLRVDRTVYLNNDVDISAYVASGAEAIQAALEELEADERRIFEAVQTAAMEWERRAAITQKLNRALTYLQTPEVKHTGNEWRKMGAWAEDGEISNRVYRMEYGIIKPIKCDSVHVPAAWFVTWELWINSPIAARNKKIAGQKTKRFADEAAAMKYLEGRKRAYAHLFTELSPKIPKQYARCFSIGGMLLPGYTVEE